VGIMVEVPAAAATADLLAREAAFFSLGTNDLIQYALAVDRGNESVAYLYQPLHPAVLRMLRFVVRAGRDRGIDVSICGEMAGDPSLTRMLVGLGIREMSVQPRSIAALRETIRRLDSAEATRLADLALAEFSLSDVEREKSPGEPAPS
jgi:phosphotransferase system enzyme I (PtsI)